MRFLKYLIVITFLIITKNAYSACEIGVHGSFESNLSDPPYSICASHTDFGSNKCIMEIYTMEQRTGGWTLFGQTTGQTCTAETELNTPVQYTCTDDVCPVSETQPCPSTHDKGLYNGELSCVKKKTEEETTLQCIDDYCMNPDNKTCPAGYTKGTFNNQAVCAKKDIPDDEEGETCEGENCSTSTDIIGAINDSKTEIKGSISGLKDSIQDSINALISKFDEWFTKLDAENNEDGGTGDNDDDGTGDNEGDGSGLDTTGLTAEVPYINNNENKRLQTNIFSYSNSCPPDNTLNINIVGRSYSYTFKYKSLCDGLGILGFFFLALAYAYSCKIVVNA